MSQSETPRFTKVRYDVTTAADWTAVGIPTLAATSWSVISAPAGETVQAGPTGLSVLTDRPVRVVADFVYRVPATDTTVQICHGSNGTVSATVRRLTEPTPVLLASLDDKVTDGSTVANCQNRASATVSGASMAPQSTWPRPVDPRRLVLSFYYPWYGATTFTQRATLERPIGPYETDTPPSVASMVRQAAGAGIDGFISSYNGTAASASGLDGVISGAGAVPGFFALPILELEYLAWTSGGSISAPSLEAWMRQVLSRDGASTYLRVGTRPVVMLYGTSKLTTSVWSQVLSDLHRSGVDPFVVGDSTDLAFGFDGLYFYSPNAFPDTAQLPRIYDDWEFQGRYLPQRGLGDAPALLALPVSPGENDADAGKPAGQSTFVDRAGGTRYDATWQDALATDPDWVLVTSWNEFYEASNVQPGTVTGHRALDQTAGWSKSFRFG